MSLWRHRYLIVYLIRHEIASRYHTALLGILWTVLLPLSYLGVYTLVFGYIFHPQWTPLPKPAPYPLILFTGLVPYFFVTEVFNQAPTLLKRYSTLITKSLFPSEVLPIVLVGRALTDNLITLLLLLLVGWFLNVSLFSWNLLLLPLAYLPLIFLALAGAWFLASVGIYLPDSAPLIQVFTRFWMFLTPIVYPLTRVPKNFVWMLYLNPLTAIVKWFRATVLWSQPWDWAEWLIWLNITALLCFGAYRWFEYTKEGFPDVL